MIKVWESKQVVFCKRSMATGYAGAEVRWLGILLFRGWATCLARVPGWTMHTIISTE